MIKQAINDLLDKKDLMQLQTIEVMNEIMEGNAKDSQIAAFLTAIRMKGESIDEITACASVMRSKCKRIHTNGDVIDIVGTGADNSSTFNISTIAAIVVAAAKIPVAKHGNRSASGKCGSADLLEEMGVKIDIPPELSQKIFESLGICFMYAPIYHNSMKYVASVRKELGIRTIFNILGPLCNPAFANTQLLGVYDEKLLLPMARVLSNLGIKRAIVVHGADGLDEITLCDKTLVCEVNGENIKSYDLNSFDFGFEKCDPQELKGEGAKENAKIALNILNGEKSSKRDVVIMNSAASIYIAKGNLNLRECVKIAQNAIDSKAALNLLNEFVKMSNEK